jgi:hypothetical protein
MSDIARVLLTAAILSASALSTYAWRLTRLDSSDPNRVIGELHLAQWAALLLAAIGGIPIGIAVARETVTAGTLDVSIGLVFILLAGYVQRREPRDALLLAAIGFVLHALTDIAHRPGWLATGLTPRWYVVGCAVYDVYLAALCYWARRRA